LAPRTLHSFPTRRSSDLQISCTNVMQDVNRQCPKIRDNRALGAALIGGGAAAVTLGGAWIYISGGLAGVGAPAERADARNGRGGDRKSTRLNSSHDQISY